MVTKGEPGKDVVDTVASPTASKGKVASPALASPAVSKGKVASSAVSKGARASKERARKYTTLAAQAFLAFIALYVMFHPGVAYAPVQRSLIFVTVAFMVALGCGQQVASARLEIKLGWLAATYTGVFAVVFGLSWWLTKLSAPHTAVAVYHVYNEDTSQYRLDLKGTVDIKETKEGSFARAFVDGNTMVIIFPEQAPEIEVGIRFPPMTGNQKWTTLSFAGTSETDLVIADSGLTLRKR